MRKPRLLKDGALYHVSARANRKEMILDSDKMKDLFMAVVIRAKKKYRFQIENFCIMGNHYHLMIRPASCESLSRIMQWIMSVFAMSFNRIHGYTGHVWGGRFFSRIIDHFRDFLLVYTYIDNNPLDACQVPCADDWFYGGLWHARKGGRDLLGEIPQYVNLLFPERTLLMLPEPY